MGSCADGLAENLLERRDSSDDTDFSAIVATLVRFGSAALRFAAMHHVRIVKLLPNERYSDVSQALQRMDVNVDGWPAPPAGLFVVEERRVYLRSQSPMTVAHEFGHALDCALGGGVYRSGVDPRVRAYFASARAFVTPYAATALDEYFAEALRAYVECNDPASFWPHATRERLRRVDPSMFAYVDELFAGEFRAAA
jgi:hypothetical protein